MLEAIYLKKAFEKRFGKVDHDSFIEVVEAFFTEYERDSTLIVPVHIVDGEYQPVIYSKSILRALVIVSDAEYMRYFEDQSYMGVKAKGVVDILRTNEFLHGIIINPFSPYHCFLPREDTFAYLAQMEEENS